MEKQKAFEGKFLKSLVGILCNWCRFGEILVRNGGRSGGLGLFYLKFSEGGGLDEAVLEGTQLCHVRLLNVDLLVVFGLPGFDQQQLVGVVLREVVVVADATVLSTNRGKDFVLLDGFYKGFALAGQAFENNVNGVHGGSFV